jgi:hypothetical protein
VEVAPLFGVYSVRKLGGFQMVAKNAAACNGCQFGYLIGGAIVLSDPNETWSRGKAHHVSSFSSTQCRDIAFGNTFTISPYLKQRLQESDSGQEPVTAENESAASADTITIQHGTTNAAP